MTMKRSILSILAFLLGHGALAASVQVTNGVDGKPRVVMATKALRVQIDPQRGGRVDSFQYAPWGKEDIIKDKGHGLFCDHFWQERWPGQFWDAVYDYKVVAQGPDEIAVRVSCLSRAGAMPEIAGILVEKTFTLREADDKVRVSIRLTNTAAEGKFIGYWQQHVCWLGDGKEGDRYFRPAKRGVSVTSSDAANPPDKGFIREPQDGWTAAVDARTGHGLVFLMAYNDLWFLYNCPPANTIEWQYDAVAIPAGKHWETAVTMMPTTGLPAISYASDRLLAGVECREETGNLAVVATFQSVDGPLASLDVAAGLTELVSHKTAVPPEPRRLANLNRDTQTVTFSVPYDTAKREPAALRLDLRGADAAGKPLTASPEFWYGGNWVSNTKPGDGSPYYAIPSRPKVKSVIKPDVIARVKSPTPKVLYLKGFQSTAYGIEPALAALKPEVAVKVGYAYNGGVFGPQLDHFPYDYPVLLGYDLVILGDLSVGYLDAAALEMLKDYCAHGGNLLVLGGPFAYERGGYRESVLAEMLPVECREGVAFAAPKGKVTAAAPFDGIDDLGALRFFYLHAVTPKPGADTLVRYGTAPLLVGGRYGEGAVTCVMATPLGKLNGCDTPQWRELLARLLPTLGLMR